jgi:hypothetical protein
VKRASLTGGLAVITTVAIVGLVVLAALGRAIPDVLGLVVVSGLSGIAGVTIPTGADASSLGGVVAGLIERVEALARHEPTPAPLPEPAPVTDAQGPAGGTA